ncbi:MAG: patatin-like phospholipase family protein, partial [Planctomycetales bacterium]
ERLWDRIRRTFTAGLSAPRYDGSGFNRVLQDVYGGARFGDLEIQPTLAVSYNAYTRSAVVFKNTSSQYADLPVWEVVRASSSAPSYFPAHIMDESRMEVPFIDGAVVANNPTAVAIAEAVRRQKMFDQSCDLSDFVVASFGTGQNTRRITAKEAQEWGALQWALPVMDVLLDGASDAVDYIARQLISEDRYFRFQCPLQDGMETLDDAGTDNLNAMVALVEEQLFAGDDRRMDDLVALLQEEPASLLKEEEHAATVPFPKPVPRAPEMFKAVFRRQRKPDPAAQAEETIKAPPRSHSNSSARKAA